MQVVVLKSHEDEQPDSPLNAQSALAIVSLLPEGYEQDLVRAFDRIPRLVQKGVEIVAAISTTIVEKDGYWRTPYQLATERKKGDLTLWDTDITFWLCWDGEYRKGAWAHQQSAFQWYEQAGKNVNELSRWLWAKLTEGIGHRMAKLDREIVEQTVETQGLYAERARFKLFDAE